MALQFIESGKKLSKKLFFPLRLSKRRFLLPLSCPVFSRFFERVTRVFYPFLYSFLLRSAQLALQYHVSRDFSFNLLRLNLKHSRYKHNHMNDSINE
ncbi:hypothetical protein H6P81_016502 [Aristolochia fimbriata]|uniref:Uncharacterized protein n=1 Tax=Aristolochia fimbriata TaxID=158543 RepID=A0AAV7E8J1_ARIFI|nr:hypothetical protein H6P81_016502 [Aristolochia fimbriata]